MTMSINGEEKCYLLKDNIRVQTHFQQTSLAKSDVIFISVLLMKSKLE